VLAARDVASIYELPLTLAAEGLDDLLLHYLRIDARPADLSDGRTSSTAPTTQRTRSPSPSWVSMSSTKIVTNP